MVKGDDPVASVADSPPDIALPRAINPKDHPCHSEELAIAMACWQALFADAGSAAPLVRKKDILDWLGELYPHLPQAAATRIATVALPSKKPGKADPR